MSISYTPPNGTILICSFSGIKPEMEKRRPVIILSAISYRLALVVPLSTTWPEPPMPWHYLLKLQKPLPGHFTETECWAKCDMIAPVSFDRLDLFYNGKDRNGKRKYLFPKISDEELEAMRTCVVRAVYGY